MSIESTLNVGRIGSTRPPEPASIEYTPPATIEEAREAKYIGFLHRHPFATDAYELGFVTGVREDYELQTDNLQNVNLPVLMLDNDYRDADVERYIQSFRTYEPEIGVLGDAYTKEEAIEYNELARELKDEFDTEIIVVPKCREAIEALDQDIVLGYAMGYSDIHATDFSDVAEWRGRRVHLLGASPPKQWKVIQQLTQPTISGDPPADIVGADWNGIQKIAYKGEYWTRDGWESADRFSIRETVQKGLQEIKKFWQERGVWPEENLVDEYDPAVMEPDELIFADNGSHITQQETLEDTIVVEYECEKTGAYSSEIQRKFIEYREGLTPSNRPLWFC
ncbi:DUF6610 family protein [Halorussus sp. AFM4]|uniref:DUF6610 family protein n=1 Tax=Halorussus sp. AFM4 TaxID=3421651 RepID=UPI003EBAAC40